MCLSKAERQQIFRNIISTKKVIYRYPFSLPHSENMLKEVHGLNTGGSVDSILTLLYLWVSLFLSSHLQCRYWVTAIAASRWEQGTARWTALHHTVMSWQRLSDRHENTWRTCKSSLTHASLQALSEAICLSGGPFHHKLLSRFV